MTPSDAAKLTHLAWSVDARAENQRCALRLLRLFKEHPTKWTSQRRARAAQSLLAVTFSLWRAAFLAEKTGKRAAVFSAGVEFLERLIADNSIAYPQDRKSNEWTFNYYTKNAKAALQELAAKWPKYVQPYNDEIRKPIDRWAYCQKLLDGAISAFEEEARVPRQNPAQAARAATRRARDERRKLSREVRLAARGVGAKAKPTARGSR